MKTPPHPGQFVRFKIIGPRGLSVKDAAFALGIHRVALSRFLNEQAALSPEMAIRLEKAFGADMEYLMRMQTEYDISQAKLKFTSVKVVQNFQCNEQNRSNSETLTREFRSRFIEASTNTNSEDKKPA
ncbi:HigA family addiction module antidote protein (plasmid) [Rhizobium sp. 007]|nr:HigA family addiction module antidote protein [Rhizobium sp. 007]